ncbi:hypothetical protein CC1G_06477 [Coprinopsis cinerea okayama7|uniref:C2H2-type domain-containing protein n=1 Tax=Coprinopsis cinerea (strain Okayama-7 / 130 / ATCC MYA-4618 / FGSC 9003) TaxID=240176 RepID=A8NN91_COPC7|nr:hypothetical protein CC1G_06477 [Coprinopsis cinerea okayama7\|eukprot:XP_001835074.1 hypothetical protein CC1G_06477 [Coprinopsis cinerea okayama7\
MPSVRSAPLVNSLRVQQLNNKVITCSECRKTFTRSSDLRRHVKLHDETSAGLFCSYPNCTFATRQRSNMRTHLATHMGEKRHTCNLNGCTFRCADSASLIRHRKKVHGCIRQPRVCVSDNENENNKPNANAKSRSKLLKSRAEAMMARLKANKRAPISKPAPSVTDASDALPEDWFDAEFREFLESITATPPAFASIQLPTIKPDEPASGQPGFLDLTPIPETLMWDDVFQQPALYSLGQQPWDLVQSFPCFPATP